MAENEHFKALEDVISHTWLMGCNVFLLVSCLRVRPNIHSRGSRMVTMDHWLHSEHQLRLLSGPIGPAVTSTQASGQFKGYSADTCPTSA